MGWYKNDVDIYLNDQNTNIIRNIARSSLPVDANACVSAGGNQKTKDD